MTQSIPSQSTNDITHHKRLMELIEAEDAANGEVGCGSDLGDKISVHFSTRSNSIFDDNLRSLLREHLGHLLMERDFDSIVTQVYRFVELEMVSENVKSEHQLQPVVKQIVEHIPNEKLKLFYQAELEFFDEASLSQLVLFTHEVVHKAVLHPRHTWSKPIWVLTTGEKVYIAQASSLEDAVAMIKVQYPEEDGKLEVVTVGGVLASEQVICLNSVDL